MLEHQIHLEAQEVEDMDHLMQVETEHLIEDQVEDLESVILLITQVLAAQVL